MSKNTSAGQPVAREGYFPVPQARLFFREIGRGQTIVVLHGGPDFDQYYLQPELDRLAESFRIIYYDQRGRGRSTDGIEIEQVTLQSEMVDLTELRKYFQLDPFVLLGHSWGGLLAMEYALRYPHQLSHLILMNTAPASHADLMAFRQERQQTYAAELEQMEPLLRPNGTNRVIRKRRLPTTASILVRPFGTLKIWKR